MNVLAEIRDAYIKENPKRFEDGPSLAELAARYDVSYTTVRQLADKEDWDSKRQNHIDKVRANKAEFGDERLTSLEVGGPVNLTDAASVVISDLVKELGDSVRLVTNRLREVFADTGEDDNGRPNISPALLLEYGKFLFQKQKFLVDISIKMKQVSDADSKEIKALIQDIQEGASLIRAAKGDPGVDTKRAKAVADWDN
jgi:hypothetical protein